MIAYAHPAAQIAVFKTRLATDLKFDQADATGLTLACSLARPISASADHDCVRWTDLYNSEVDLLASGSLQGEKDSYYYNRISLDSLIPPGPYAGLGVTQLVDLIPQINAACQFTFLPTDWVNRVITADGCTCGDNGVPTKTVIVEASEGNLLFTGQVVITLVMNEGYAP